MAFWDSLFDVGVLLAVALFLGALCERFRQSALLGYLLAGMLLGPAALNVVGKESELDGLAELGVSLLLFSLGLEFSWRRLRALGRAALGGGTLQIALTLAVLAVIAMAFGFSPKAAFVLGAGGALSSTAGVLRVLMARAETDSVHGRFALGILLFQDLAIIPLVLVAELLASAGGGSTAVLELGRTVLVLLAMVVAFFLVFRILIPRFLLVASTLRNRELPVLLGVVAAFASIYVAHELGLSPAVGAFIAGMLLGESPFATQVRSDLSVLRTLLVTLFFASIGMLANPIWMAEHAGAIAIAVLIVVLVKPFLVWLSLRLVRQPTRGALATGIALAQVGEFAFVIAGSVRGTIFNEEEFLLVVSTMMVTLFVTPYLVERADRISVRIHALVSPRRAQPKTAVEEGDADEIPSVVLIGFGPAGELCAESLRGRDLPLRVLDLSPTLVRKAEDLGYRAAIGDATHADVLEHFHVASARAVIVAVPDPHAAEQIVRLVRSLSTVVPIVVRSRYHRHRAELEEAGASIAVDEEEEVGRMLGERVAQVLR